MSEATCPRCGRTRGMESAERCYEPGVGSCLIAAAGYRAGIDEGVRLAKERAGIAWCSEIDAEIDWTDVDKAAEAVKGET